MLSSRWLEVALQQAAIKRSSITEANLRFTLTLSLCRPFLCGCLQIMPRSGCSDRPAASQPAAIRSVLRRQRLLKWKTPVEPGLIWTSGGPLGEAGQRQRPGTKVTSAQLSWEYKGEGKKWAFLKVKVPLHRRTKWHEGLWVRPQGLFLKTEVQSSGGMDEPQSKHLETGYAKKRKENLGYNVFLIAKKTFWPPPQFYFSCFSSRCRSAICCSCPLILVATSSFFLSAQGTQTSPFKNKHSNFVRVCLSFCHIWDSALFHFTPRGRLLVSWPTVPRKRARQWELLLCTVI